MINWNMYAQTGDNIREGIGGLADIAGVSTKAKNRAALDQKFSSLASLGSPETGAMTGLPLEPQREQFAGNPKPQEFDGPLGTFSNKDLIDIMRNPEAQDTERALVMDEYKRRTTPKDPYAERMKQLDLQLAEQKVKSFGQTGAARRSLQPVWGVGADGKPAIVQLGDDGSAIQTALPQGFDIANKPIEMDLGTKILLLDPQTRQPIGERQKDIAGVEAQQEIGTVQGKKIAGAPGDVVAADSALSVLDNILSDPVMTQPGAYGTGISSVANAIPGTPGYNFQTKINQVQGVAFLQAIQQLRGMGALSNAEGQTATAAITRINSGLSQNDLRTAIQELRTIIEQGRARAASLAGGGQAAPSAPAAPASGGFRILSVE